MYAMQGDREATLQCGHGPSAVETSALSVDAALQMLLQCGHGPSAVETPSWMRLRAWSTSFNAATARQPWRPGVATTGEFTTIDLQCGHGPSAVETWSQPRP